MIFTLLLIVADDHKFTRFQQMAGELNESVLKEITMLHLIYHQMEANTGPWYMVPMGGFYIAVQGFEKRCNASFDGFRKS